MAHLTGAATAELLKCAAPHDLIEKLAENESLYGPGGSHTTAEIDRLSTGSSARSIPTPTAYFDGSRTITWRGRRLLVEKPEHDQEARG